MTNTINIKELIGGGYNRFWHSKNFYRVIKGGRGSKKSKTAAINFIYRIMQYPWANLLVLRRYSNTNKQSTYTDMKWAAAKLGVYDLFKFNESIPQITYKPTGQKIIFVGLDDPLKVTSMSVEVGYLCWLFVEEAYQIDNMGDLDTVIESIRGKAEGVPDFFKQITILLNPWHENHFIKREFFDEETQRYDTLALTTTYKCNEWLDDVDIKRLEDLYRTNPRRAKIVCDGDWGVSEGLVFDGVFKVKDFDIQTKVKELRETTHGIDYGFTHDPTAIISTAVDMKNKELWIYDEHYEVGMLTNDIFNALKQKGLHKTELIAESAEPRLNAELRNKGVRKLTAAPKPKGSIAQGIMFIQDFKVYIHPSCINTIMEFNSYAWKQDRSGKWLNEPEDKNNHLMDALRYSLTKYHIKKENNNEDTVNALKALGL